jgi:hypothetical protein
VNDHTRERSFATHGRLACLVRRDEHEKVERRLMHLEQEVSRSKERLAA